MVCLGYTDDEATAAAFDDDGWFRTGDLGVLRPDGHLALTGRLKDVIIRKGAVSYTHLNVEVVSA